MSICRARAPLRLGLAGGGTDVSPYCDLHGGAVLSATISLYAYASLRPSEDGLVHFVAHDQNLRESFVHDDAPRSESSLALHQGVYNRIIRQFNGGTPLPLVMETSCDAPAGSGLGSSSTLVVAMLSAFAEKLNLPLGEYDLAQLAYDIERNEVGLHGGRQDQYAAAFGGFNFLEFPTADHALVNPLRIKDWIVSELESSMVLYFTGKSRSSAQIIEQESQNVRENNVAAIEAMHNVKKHAFEMKEALLRGRIRQMGEIMQDAWDQKKRMASGISNQSIDDTYDYALQHGAFCGKVSGAGGGGFMMFFADPSRRVELVAALRKLEQGEVLKGHFTAHGASAWRAE